MVMEVKALEGAPVGPVRTVDPDVELVVAAQARPRDFLALYDRYIDRVHGYVRLRIHDPATCEDVTSQVFTTALAKLGRFRGDGSFAGWLFQIAHNAVVDAYRDSRPVAVIPERPTAEPTPEERVLERERADALRGLIKALRPQQQHMLALRYGAGLSFDEIATLTGTAPGTARVRLHRILTELRRRYPHDVA